MAEFVNLEESNDSLNITSPSLESIESLPSNNEIYTVDSSQIIVDPSDYDAGCSLGSCDPEQYYGDANPDDSFKKSNLFSELVDEYQRAVARRNLGIADSYAMLWGNISGNIANQIDLVNYIKNQIDTNNLDIDGKLTQLLNTVTQQLALKANLDSPNFIGTPTVPLPSLSDNSNQIASTAWVTAKVENSFALNYLVLDKTYMFYGDSPVALTCTWDYSTPIESQQINGVSIPIDDRSYTFTNVNTSKTIQLTYIISGKSYSKSIVFEIYYPIYYGISETYTLDNKTKDNSFTITCNDNEYAYILIPLNSDARIAVDNLVGGFEMTSSITINGMSFYIYKSVNSGLGKLYITIL